VQRELGLIGRDLTAFSWDGKRMLYWANLTNLSRRNFQQRQTGRTEQKFCVVYLILPDNRLVSPPFDIFFIVIHLFDAVFVFL